MIELERSLTKKLRKQRVRIEVPDENTVFFRNVPTNERFFNKPRTNVLIQASRERRPLVVGVDEDLEYHGKDRELTRTFASAPRQRGWRLLWLEPPGSETFEQAVRQVLKAIGFEGDEPSVPLARSPVRPAKECGILKSFGTDLSCRAVAGKLDPCVGRREGLVTILSCLLQHHGRLPVIAAAGGFGKTNLLGGLAGELNRLRPEIRLVRFDLVELFSGTQSEAARENLLSALLQEAGPETVVALEHFELTFIEAPHGPMLLEGARAEKVKLIGTAYAGFLQLPSAMPLHDRFQMVELTELTEAETGRVLEGKREALATHHRVRIPESACAVALERSKSLVGPWPAKAIDLLDAAGAHAVLAGAPEVEELHIYLAASRLPEIGTGC